MKQLAKLISQALILAGVCVPSLSHAGAIIVDNCDDRPMSNVTCQVDFIWKGNHYLDWQDMGDWPTNQDNYWAIAPSRCSCDGGECRGDCLYYQQTSNGSGLLIISKTDNPQVYSGMYMDCWFTINDAPHYDWEFIGDWNGSGDIRLILNGQGGTWDGSQWVGDFLRPGSSC